MNKLLKLQLFPGPCWSYWYSQKPLDSLLPLSTSLSFGWNCSNGQKSKWSVRLSHGGYTKVGVDSPKWLCYFLEQWPLEWANEQPIFPTYLNCDPPLPPFQNELPTPEWASTPFLFDWAPAHFIWGLSIAASLSLPYISKINQQSNDYYGNQFRNHILESQHLTVLFTQ